MQRAKDLNGLLTILANASRALNRAVPILSRLPDTESQIQSQDLNTVRTELEMAGRDLAGGIVDLRELPFDEHAWGLNFNESAVQLASEPDPQPFPHEVPVVERTQVRDELFDFDSQPQDLGEAPDLLAGIDTDQPTQDDTPTVPILENL